MRREPSGIGAADIRALLRQGDFARYVKEQMRATREECQRRRALVLAHPDLAERLCCKPLRHRKPEEWNGWIPPEMWREERNNAPERAALVEIVAEAERRAGASYREAA